MNVPLVEPAIGGTVGHILSLLPSLRPGAQRVAQFCAERPADVIDMSGADLAEATDTSPATVSRTCRDLGFNGYQHLRMLLIRDMGARSVGESNRPGGTAGFLSECAENAASVLRNALSAVDPDAFDQAATAIAQAARFVVAGTGASHRLAQSAATDFAIHGRWCEAPVDALITQIVGRMLGPGDVCLAVSSSGANVLTMATVEAARAAGAVTVLVTAFRHTPMARLADHELVVNAGFGVSAGTRSWRQAGTGAEYPIRLLLSALQLAVAERMPDISDRAQAILREEVAALVAEDETESSAPSEGSGPVSAP